MSHAAAESEEDAAEQKREQIAHSLFEAGNGAYEREALTQAEKLYTKALSLSPSDPLRCTILSNRSAVRLKKEDMQGAVADAREAILLNPCWAKAHHRLGSALLAMQKLALAWTSFQTARELDRQNLLYQTTMKNVEHAMCIRGEEAELEQLKKASHKAHTHQYVANHDNLMSDHLSKVGWLKICTPKSLKWERKYVELSHHGEIFMSSDTFGADREPLVILGDTAVVLPSVKYSRTLKICGEKVVPLKVKLKMENHEQYIAWTKACKAEVGKSRAALHAKELTNLRLSCGRSAKRAREEADKTISALKEELASTKENHTKDLGRMLKAAAKKGATHSGRKSWASVLQMKRLEAENKVLRAQVAKLTNALQQGGALPADFQPPPVMKDYDTMEGTGQTKREQLQLVFNMFDADGSGSLSLKETAMLMKKLRLDPSDSELIRMVESADSDNSGSIEFEEFVKMMEIARVSLADLQRVTATLAISEPIAEHTKPHRQGPEVPSRPGQQAQWTPHTDPATGKQYFFNEVTRVTQWHAPPDMMNVMGEKEIQDRAVARSMFDSFDTDKSGSIDMHELRRAMTSMGLNPSEEDLAKMVLAGDEDNDGLIDFEEFVKMMEHINTEVTVARISAGAGSSDSKAGEAKQGSATATAASSTRTAPTGADPAASVVKLATLNQQQVVEARALFDRFDVDHSDSISADELVAVLSHLGHFPTPDELHAMLDVADSDQSGELDFNEFLQMLVLVPRDTEWEEFEDAESGKPYFRHKGSGKVMWNRLEEMGGHHKEQLKSMFPEQSPPTEAKRKR